MTGVRFRWTFPGDHSTGTKDGSIIVNHTRPATPLIYDGMDGELFDLFLPNVSTLGLKKGNPVPYKWLVYSVGHTSSLMLAGGDILTGYMSGCLITQWTDQFGYRWVGHIGTIDSDKNVSTAVKTFFAVNMAPGTTGFNPKNAWNVQNEIIPKHKKFKSPPEIKILALVTSGGLFYSILMFKLSTGGNDLWCCGGIKRVDPTNYRELFLQLTS